MPFQTHNPRLSDLWTEERIILLLKLDSENALSRAGIATALAERTGSCFSRNAIIGKLARLGVPLKAKKCAAPKKSKGPKIFIVHKKSEPLPPPTPVLQESMKLTLEQLTPATCHYPAGDQAPFEFCGHPVFDRSYCAAHFKICYYNPGASRPDASFRMKRFNGNRFRLAACG